jgi:hypothetical protein
MTVAPYGLTFDLDRVRRDRHEFWGELIVKCEIKGAKTIDGILSASDFNLSGQAARVTRAKYLAERAQVTEIDWIGLVEEFCQRVIAFDREGDPVIALDDAPDRPARDLDIHGLKVPGDAASLLVAHGDSLKSMITLYTLGTMAQRGQAVLYVDWEWTADRHRARKQRLFGPERLDGLYYLRCRAPLTLECDRIRRFCDTSHIDFIAIDSIGLASDGKLVDDDVAIRFHRALSTLPPALCAAHVPKSAINADPKTDAPPFGSVYFSNLCRASWAVKKQPGATDDLVTVGLFPSKQNDGARQRPIGLEFSFTAERITVHPVNLAGVDGLAERLSLSTRMHHLLTAGPLSFVEMASRLDAKVDSVIKAANRHEGFIKVLSADGITRIGLVA